MLYIVVHLVRDAVVLGKVEPTTRVTTKATRAPQRDGHTRHPATVIVPATPGSKAHIRQDCIYLNTHPETLASSKAASSVQHMRMTWNRNQADPPENLSELQEVRARAEKKAAHYPTCSICDTKGHFTRDCRRWLDPEPDPEPPGTDRLSVFYEPNTERIETHLAVFTPREHRRRNQAEPGPDLRKPRTKVMSRRVNSSGSARGNAKPLCKGEICQNGSVSDPTPKV